VPQTGQAAAVSLRLSLRGGGIQAARLRGPAAPWSAGS
jgi:hypothetical protein